MDKAHDSFGIVSTSVDSLAEAETLARRLVEARLVACVQILPATSVYRWDGAVITAAEHVLLCKIRHDDRAEVEAAIASHHPYDVPEIVVMPIEAASSAYSQWLTDETERSPQA